MDVLTDYILAPLLNLLSKPLSSWPLRRYIFGTQHGTDVHLPPCVGGGDIVSCIRRFGVWGRHAIDQQLVKSHGHVYCLIPPPAMGGGLVKLVVNVSDPVLVKQVLEDFVNYPTRGTTGLSDTVGMGLVELPTGDTHSFHRRIVGSLLTSNHLKKYAVTVQEETNTLLLKWHKIIKNSHGTRISAATEPIVNAHYDLMCCAQEIIGRIGLGQRFGTQDIAEEDNTNAHDAAFMMRRAAISTAVGKSAMNWISNSKDVQREETIRQNGYQETIDRIQTALNAKGMNMVKGMDEAKDEETGQIFTPQEIIDEFITIRGAGHETTSNTLSWAMMLLAENPSIQEGTFEGRFIGVSVLI